MMNKKEEYKNFRFFKKLSKFEKGELNNFVKMNKEIEKGKNKMNITLLNELINKIANEFIGNDNKDFISEIHDHELLYNKENYDLVFKKIGVDEFVKMVMEKYEAITRKNEREFLLKSGKVIDENIENSCLDYVLVTLGIAPHLKNNLDVLIDDINEEKNTSGISRNWEKQEVLKVTLLLKALKWSLKI